MACSRSLRRAPAPPRRAPAARRALQDEQAPAGERDLLGQARRVGGGAQAGQQRRAVAVVGGALLAMHAQAGAARRRVVSCPEAAFVAGGARGARARPPGELPGSVLLQIGQRSMKRLCRQKVGIAEGPRGGASSVLGGIPGPTCCGGPSGPFVGVGVAGETLVVRGDARAVGRPVAPCRRGSGRPCARTGGPR